MAWSCRVGERSRQTIGSTRDILTTQKIGQVRQIFRAGELLEDNPEQEDAEDIGSGSKGWTARPQVGQPAEHMRIPAQVFETLQLGMTVEEIEQETTRRAAVDPIGSGTERRADVVDGARERGGKRVIERGMTREIHGSWGTGRTSWATARAYCW